MKLFGTITSPYVRRVRIVCDELGLDYELCDTATEDGQRELRANTPIWKVPTLRIGDEIIFDSHTILDVLIARYGTGQFDFPSADDIEGRNLLNVVDTALDSLISAFYVKKDGAAADFPYVVKQQQRAESAMNYLQSRLPPIAEQLTAFEIALATTVTWIQFRNAYAIENHPAIVAYVESIENRSSFRITRPV
jgi:glutathione S-transferase